MNCQQIDKLVFEYCDNMLSPEMRLEVEKHLDICINCRRMVELSQLESSVLADKSMLPCLSEDFTARLMNIIGNKNTRSSKSSIMPANRKKWYRLPFYWSGALVAALIVLILNIPGILPKDYINLDNNQIYNQSDNSRDINSEIKSQELPETLMKKLEEPTKISSTDSQSMSITPDAVATGNNELDSSFDSEQGNTMNRANTKQFQLLESTPTRGEQKVSPLSDTAATTLAVYKSTYIHPQNLPAEYSIEKIVNADPQNITYIYRNKVNRNIVEIIITLQEEEAPTPENKVAATRYRTEQPEYNSEAESTAMNSLKNNINYNGDYFSVNIRSVIPAEELQKLAGEIEFKEVNQNGIHN